MGLKRLRPVDHANGRRSPRYAPLEGPCSSRNSEDSVVGATVLGAAMMAPSLEFHPLANIFPLLEGEPFNELVADIRAHGLREPIVLLSKKILDGRNRHLACLAAQREPLFVDYFGASRPQQAAGGLPGVGRHSASAGGRISPREWRSDKYRNQ
jgi:hypothetical protein